MLHALFIIKVRFRLKITNQFYCFSIYRFEKKEAIVFQGVLFFIKQFITASILPVTRTLFINLKIIYIVVIQNIIILKIKKNLNYFI